jgi:transcriptional regulator with XRE-family HTH domain
LQSPAFLTQMIFHQYLALQKVEAGYFSYETFAIEHDLSRAYYWQVERGRNISTNYLFKLLEIFEITPEEFFKGIV